MKSSPKGLLFYCQPTNNLFCLKYLNNMPRIFKGSACDLKLFIPSCDTDADVLIEKVKLYPYPYDDGIVFSHDFEVEGNFVIVHTPSWIFLSDEEGVINYLIEGKLNGKPFNIYRQSNYYLKDSKGTSNNEDLKPGDTTFGKLEETITENGMFTYKPSDVDAWTGATITVEVGDVNGSYEEGYDKGYFYGYTEGGKEGYNAGITEGYASGRTDGYNAGVEEGLNNAGGIIAETARVLNVTENGVYTSKYTKEDEIVMPYELWGDDFYNYSYVKNKIWNTGIIPNKNTRLEFWWRPDVPDRNTSNKGVVISTNNTYAAGWGIVRNIAGNSSYDFRIGNTSGINIFLPDYEFYHIIMSYEDGLIINGELVGTFSDGSNRSEPLYINGVPSDIGASEDGTYGMIKIDDVIIIPTKDGFLNTNTGELLEVVCDGDYKFTEIEKPTIEGNLYRTINVDVKPKIRVADTGFKFAYSAFGKIPEWADFEDVTDLTRMFFNCTGLQEVRLIDTSKVTDMSSAFYGCGKIETIALLDTSNVTNMSQMCYGCGFLTEFPPLDTSNVTNMSQMFNGCGSLISVPALDARSVVKQSYGIFSSGNLNNLTDFGGLIGLKASMDGNYGFEKCPNLTYESCINILNGLYDFIGNNITPASNEGKLKVHSNFLSTVGDDIAIATGKGWTITT